jgi:hypothetical protein
MDIYIVGINETFIVKFPKLFKKKENVWVVSKSMNHLFKIKLASDENNSSCICKSIPLA